MIIFSYISTRSFRKVFFLFLFFLLGVGGVVFPSGSYLALPVLLFLEGLYIHVCMYVYVVILSGE